MSKASGISRKLLYAGAFILTIIIIFTIVGLLLPSSYHVERKVVIDAPASRVFPHINNLKNWRAWMVWVQRDPNMEIGYSGPESGVGAVSEWTSESQGSGKMTITRSKEPELVAYELYFPEWDSTTTGDLTIVEDGETVEVTWAMDGENGMNPINRIMGAMMDRMVGPDFEQGLVNLKKVVESEVSAE